MENCDWANRYSIRNSCTMGLIDPGATPLLR